MRRIAVQGLIVIAGLIVATGCGQFGKKATDDSSSKLSSSDEQTLVTSKPFDAAARKKYGCTDVEVSKSAGRKHVEGKVDYKDFPPTSGNHYEVPLEWGIYDDERDPERWVHNLEHGHIVMLYKGISDSELKDLKSQIERDSDHLVLIPQKRDPKDGVYYLAWTAKIHCDKPSPPALQYMINNYRDQGPELISMDASR